jgi:hypothetical protein
MVRKGPRAEVHDGPIAKDYFENLCSSWPIGSRSPEERQGKPMRYFVCAVALLAPFLIGSSNSNAGPVCDQLLHYYQTGLAPKAFARGTGTCGYSTGQKATSLEDAKWKALNFCQGYNGAKDCRIVYSQGK